MSSVVFCARRRIKFVRAASLCATALTLAMVSASAAHAQYGGARVSPRDSGPILQDRIFARPGPPPAPAAAPETPGAAPAPAIAAQPAPAVIAPPIAVPPPVPSAAATDSTVVDLIRLLVEEGVLTEERAGALIRQAQDRAVAAARGQQAQAAPLSGVAAQPSNAEAAPSEQVAANAPQSIRVPYVPAFVRNQIKDEVKQELVQQAILEHWAQPDAVPDWTRRLRFYGDFRLRYEWDMFDGRNSAFFPNFLALNAGSPFDLNNSAGTPPPLLNTTQDRERMRIRARLGLDINVADNFTAGLRIATGNTTNPVTTNQNLGTTLNKNNFLLDRAYVEYRPIKEVSLDFGRFANPLMFTELVWDDDLNFDGVAARTQIPLLPNFSVFATAVASPIETSIFNFPDNSTNKEKSRDKWLYGAQAGIDWQPSRDVSFKAAAAYYDFDSIQGQLSRPCVALSASDPCNSDTSRPGFTQGGNTMFAIRDLVATSNNPPVFQYYGLASPFRELNATVRLDLTGYDPIHFIFNADFVKNMAFNAGRIAALNPVNNRGPAGASGAPGTFAGGGTAYGGQFTIGHPSLVNRWDWNISTGYRYIESDAVVDAFTDADFHLGGTNAKGYTVGGGLGIAHNVNLFARWLSASEVSGAPYSVDIVMVDLNAQF